MSSTPPPSDPAGAGERLLLVEDDAALRAALARGLEHEGFVVDVAGDGEEAIGSFDPGVHEAVVVDLLMPKASGVSVLRAVRERAPVPVVVMSGHGDEANRVVALELGADDFVGKPVTARELALRLRIVLGRHRPPEHEVLRFDGLEIEPRARAVRVDGRDVELTAKEYELLEVLARSPGTVISRASLLQKVWSSNLGWQSAATVTEHVYRLRHKIEPDPDSPRWIQTVRGAGYRFTGERVG